MRVGDAVEGICSPVIRQDGYDNGLALACEVHGTAEAVMERGHQAYEISLDQHRVMVDHHRESFPAASAEVAR